MGRNVQRSERVDGQAVTADPRLVADGVEREALKLVQRAALNIDKSCRAKLDDVIAITGAALERHMWPAIAAKGSDVAPNPPTGGEERLRAALARLARASCGAIPRGDEDEFESALAEAQRLTGIDPDGGKRS